MSTLDLGRLRMSVGYGTHKKGRPLSPIEVGLLLRKAKDAGMSIKDCADAIHLDGTGHIGRFLRILDLPEDMQHLITWGGGKDAIGFSGALELTRISDPDDQRVVADVILADRLTSKEVRQVAQLRERSSKSIRECLNEVLGMRTKIEKRFVFIGSVSDQKLECLLGNLMQTQRDSLLKSAIHEISLNGTTGRLGHKIFTLIGGERFNASMNNIGKENLEDKIRDQIKRNIENVGPNS